MYVLGVDIGTTGTKAMIVDDNGRIAASAYQGYPLITAGEGFVEQNAEDWWDAFVSTSRQCISKIEDRHNIIALSISSQGASMVPVDKNNLPLCNAIVWMDSRGNGIKDEMLKSKTEEWFYNRTGWKLLPGLCTVKIRWLRENRPDIFNSTCKYLTTMDYINFKLTGRYVIDPTNASITQLMNTARKEWDKDILGFLDIGSDKLPELLPTGSVVGKLTGNAAGILGLDINTTVINGGHDQYCAAIGAGAFNDGDIILSTGTAWVVLAISDKLDFDEVTNISIGPHTIEGLWGALTSIPTAGLAMEWFREKLGLRISEQGTLEAETFREIDIKAAGRLDSARNLLFYPCFSGKGFPNWSLKSRASLLGLSLEHDCYDIARAIMEGVAFEMKYVLEGYKKSGYAVNSLRIMGGATRSDLWMDIIANTVECSAIRFKEPNIACLGAAIIAGAASVVFKDYTDGFRKINGDELTCPVKQPIKEAYLLKYEQYKKGMGYADSFYNSRVD